MEFKGLRFVEKNTFLHYFDDISQSISSQSIRQSQSAPTLGTSSIGEQMGMRTEGTDMQDVEWMGDIVSVMIRGIPCSCDVSDILGAVEELGFKDRYLSFHAPHRKRRLLGYAFIKFAFPEATKEFAKLMHGYKFKGKRSTKNVTVAPAHIQCFDTISNTSTKSSRRPAHYSRKDAYLYSG